MIILDRCSMPEGYKQVSKNWCNSIEHEGLQHNTKKNNEQQCNSMEYELEQSSAHDGTAFRGRSAPTHQQRVMQIHWTSRKTEKRWKSMITTTNQWKINKSKAMLMMEWRSMVERCQPIEESMQIHWTSRKLKKVTRWSSMKHYTNRWEWMKIKAMLMMTRRSMEEGYQQIKEPWCKSIEHQGGRGNCENLWKPTQVKGNWIKIEATPLFDLRSIADCYQHHPMLMQIHRASRKIRKISENQYKTTENA